MSDHDPLGMGVRIPRRDFVQGVLVSTLAGSCKRPNAAADGGPPTPSQAASTVPPAAPSVPSADGPAFRGHDDGAMDRGHWVRDRVSDAVPVGIPDSGERYDLVVVGAGMAGLAAAYTFAKQRPKASILIVDAMADIGGHAQRVTFEHANQTYVTYGGATGFEDPEESPKDVAALLREVGISEAAMYALQDPSFRERHKLTTGFYFHPRVHATASTGWVTGAMTRPWAEVFRNAPIAETARRELVAFFTARTTRLSKLPREERQRALESMRYSDFIRREMGLGELAVTFANLFAADLSGLGSDSISAAGAEDVGIPLAGSGKWDVGQDGDEDDARYPDGNHTLARCLLRAILPAAYPGPPGADAAFLAQPDYEAFDAPGSSVRVRLRTMATCIAHTSDRSHVSVHLRGPDGTRSSITAENVVMAGWGRVARRIVVGLPPAQSDALASYRTTSLLYINVLLRHFRFVKDVGIFRGYTPNGFASSLQLADPIRVGRYRPQYEPNSPIVLTLHKPLYRPGLPLDTELTTLRTELAHAPFSHYERELREELTLLFGPSGFRAQEDILGITINRWGHGYAFFGEPRLGGSKGTEYPYRRGRKRFGRIAFAGADAGGAPWMQTALKQGIRAAEELLG